MKNYLKLSIRLLVSTVFFLLFFIPVFSQDSVEEQLKLAKQYQIGMYREVDLGKAFEIYSDLALKKSPQALIELGNMYLRGEGTEQDYTTALEYFQKAASLGSVPALCRLALMYQKGPDEFRDFSKAFELYDQAATKGDPNGYYGAGYLTYKGFGVKQSYSKASGYFQKGADMGDSRCEYMLACHELMGYENNQNVEKGKRYLEKAMSHGHGWVADMIKYNMIDSLSRDYKRNPNRWSDVKNGRINHSRRTIANNAIAGQLSGEWNGKVYTYDWSGKKIVNEEDVRLTIATNDNWLTLQWFTGDTLRTSCNAERIGDEWTTPIESQQNLSSNSRWYISHSRYDMEAKGGKEVLYADFQTYDVDAREPRMPQIAVLERKKEK